jgi:hypothetical protein
VNSGREKRYKVEMKGRDEGMKVFVRIEEPPVEVSSSLSH